MGRDTSRKYDGSLESDSAYDSRVNETPSDTSRSKATVTLADGTKVPVEFYDFAIASKILRLSETECYRLLNAGHLKGFAYKRRTLLDPDSVIDLAAKIRAGVFAPDAVAA